MDHLCTTWRGDGSCAKRAIPPMWATKWNKIGDLKSGSMRLVDAFIRDGETKTECGLQLRVMLIPCVVTIESLNKVVGYLHTM
jgi:hypothetical protein